MLPSGHWSTGVQAMLVIERRRQSSSAAAPSPTVMHSRPMSQRVPEARQRALGPVPCAMQVPIAPAPLAVTQVVPIGHTERNTSHSPPIAAARTQVGVVSEVSTSDEQTRGASQRPPIAPAGRQAPPTWVPTRRQVPVTKPSVELLHA